MIIWWKKKTLLIVNKDHNHHLHQHHHQRRRETILAVIKFLWLQVARVVWCISCFPSMWLIVQNVLGSSFILIGFKMGLNYINKIITFWNYMNCHGRELILTPIGRKFHGTQTNQSSAANTIPSEDTKCSKSCVFSRSSSHRRILIRQMSHHKRR